jgi:uncharacterized protein YegL
MPAQYTDITILLDRSGSMESLKAAMESALDELLTAHKQVPSTRVSLVQFDGYNSQDVVYLDRPVTQTPRTEIVPRGTTPLRDALCYAIDGAGQRLEAKSESDRPDQVLFVIITDGLENASLVYTQEDVRTRIERQSVVYRWVFTYLGANQDAVKEASNIGINPVMAVSYAANAVGTRSVVGAVVANSMQYVQQPSGLRGMSTSMAFSSEQRASAMAPDVDPPDTDDDDDDKAVKTP